MSTDPVDKKSAIFGQFLRGEIDATAAAGQIRALPRTSPEFEFPSAGAIGSPADQVLMEKFMEFHAALRALKGPAA